MSEGFKSHSFFLLLLGLNRVVKQGRIGDVPKASKGPLSGRFLLKGGRGQFIELTSCKALTVLGFKNKAALT